MLAPHSLRKFHFKSVNVTLLWILLTFFASTGVTTTSQICQKDLCQVLDDLYSNPPYSRGSFENSLLDFTDDYNLEDGHRNLEQVLSIYGKNVSVENYMPLQAYIIKYQKLLHDEQLNLDIQSDTKLYNKIDEESSKLNQSLGIHENALVDQILNAESNILTKLDIMLENMTKLSADTAQLTERVTNIENNLLQSFDEKIKNLTKLIIGSQEHITRNMNEKFFSLSPELISRNIGNFSSSAVTHEIISSMYDMISNISTSLNGGESIIEPKQKTTTKRPFDCWELQRDGINKNGVYTIYPIDDGVQVYCDMVKDGGGWTAFIVRKRSSPQVDFKKNWNQYKIGFGNASTEYWLGNEILHLMTFNRSYTMRVDAEGSGRPKQIWGKWSIFRVASEKQKYQLSISKYVKSGTINNEYGFNDCNHRYFTTIDRDYDNYATKNCAEWVNGGGGFWYDDCGFHRPTAKYGKIRFWDWSTTDSSTRYATRLEMKIRPNH